MRTYRCKKIIINNQLIDKVNILNCSDLHLFLFLFIEFQQLILTKSYKKLIKKWISSKFLMIISLKNHLLTKKLIKSPIISKDILFSSNKYPQTSKATNILSLCRN